MKIIGITGSKGKTTTAYILYLYLKKINAKVKIYSSIDYEIAIPNNEILKEIIEYAKEERIEYLILEVNEEIINKIDIDVFDIKILTNISNINYKNGEKEYINLIESFFLFNNTKSIISYSSYMNINFFYEFIEKIENKVIVASSYVINKYRIDENIFDYTVYTEGIYEGKFYIKNKEKEKIEINTNLIFSYNTINILNVYACIKELNLYKEDIFKSILQNINVPGRGEVIEYNNRCIIISKTLCPELELLNKDSILVTASIGTCHNSWKREYNTKEQEGMLHKSRAFACKYASKYCKYIYLTSSDPASSDPKEIANEMERYLINNNFYNAFIEIDRKKAIEKAIKNSKENDIILISGRGSRKKYIKNNKEYNKSDKEIIEEIRERYGK